MAPIISTIIPVFNGERYLKKCLDSIINQTIGVNNIEIIIINDGSTDDSKLIIEKFLSSYNNIKYIEQKNKGQGVARNQGIKIAKGKYISFVDCDDTIHKDMYKEMIKEIENGNYDIVTCDYNVIRNNSEKEFKFRFIEDENKNFVIMNTGPCNMVIRKEILVYKGFVFPEKIKYEDFACIPSLAIDTKIKHIDKPFYNYYQNDNSTMNQTQYSKQLENIFEAFELLKEKVEKVYFEEIEFLYIRNIMMSASLRFTKFKDPNNQIKRISNYAKQNYPKWQNNRYYKMMKWKQKIVAILTAHNMKRVLRLLYIINERVK